MAILLLGVWIVLMLLGAKLVDRVWAEILGKGYRLFMAPGIIVHELSHAAGCLVTGATVTKLSLWERQGGYVEHTEPKLPIIGQAIVSMAPIVGCGAAIWFSALWFAGDVPMGKFLLPGDIVFTPEGIGGFVTDTLLALKGALYSFYMADFADPRTYLFLYLSLTFLIALGPSETDFKNAALGIGFIVVAALIADLVAREMGRPNGIQDIITKEAWPLLSFAAGFLGLMALVSLVARLAVWVVEFIGEKKTGHGRRK